MTAEELIEKYQRNFKENGIVYDLSKPMIEFAKYHLKLQAEAIKKNISLDRYFPPDEEVEDEYYPIGDDYEGSYKPPYLENSGCHLVINEQSVLNAYPLTNVK